MSGFRHRVATAPLAVLFAWFTVSWAVGTWALGRLLMQEPPERIWGHAVGGVVYGALMTAWFARRRKKDGGAEQQWAVGTAIRRGRLPDGADPDHWRPLLRRKRAEFTRWQPFAGIVFGLFTLMGVGLALTEGPRWWALAAFFAGMGVFSVVTARRAVRRIERMERDLGREAARR